MMITLNSLVNSFGKSHYDLLLSLLFCKHIHNKKENIAAA